MMTLRRLRSRHCHLHEGRFFDPDTGQWGYEVFCSNPKHERRRCGWEMFRIGPPG